MKILEASEFVAANETVEIMESLGGLSKTKKILSKILGNTMNTGNDVFKAIDNGIKEIEKDIESYLNDTNKQRINKSNKSNKKNVNTEMVLKFDSNMLKMSYLIKNTKLSFLSFTGHVTLANITNYKAMLSPIRNAMLISTAYEYYLIIIRQCLQQALIMLELTADSFFTEIIDTIGGLPAKMQDMTNTMLNNIFAQFDDVANSDCILNNENKTVRRSAKEMKDMSMTIDILRKNVKAVTNQYQYNNGYRKDLFQEAGRIIESMLKDDNQKEMQAIGDRFTSICRGDDSLQIYMTNIKSAAESRAYSICSNIHQNLINIIKMFNVRNQNEISHIIANKSQKNTITEYETRITALEKELQQVKKENEKLADYKAKNLGYIDDISDNEWEEVVRQLEKRGFFRNPLNLDKDDLLIKRNLQQQLHDRGIDPSDKMYDLLITKKTTNPDQYEAERDDDGEIIGWKFKNRNSEYESGESFYYNDNE